MTTVWNFGFEVSPDNTTLTTSNTSYGAMVGGGTGAKVSDNAQGVHAGSFAGKFTATGTDTAAGAYTFTDRTQMFYRAYWEFSTMAPSAQVIALSVKDNANANTVCQIVLTSSGFLRLRNSASATLATSSTSPGANTMIEIELDITNISGTTHVHARAQWGANLDTATYNWDSGDFTVSNSNVGRITEGLSTTEAMSMWIDDSIGDDSVQPGPVGGGAAIPPVSNAGPDQTVEPYDTITLDGTASTWTDPDTGVTYSWSQTSGTTVTLSDTTAAQPTFVAPAALTDANLVFSLVVTGNETLVADATADSVTITVQGATERWLDGTGTWKPYQIIAL